ncbi:MAG: adaptor protein [Nitrospirae bacterium]|jgi:ATP-dependent Clp protease adaptor protein ClpS|nr:MAG: adaptor protein [Nitrospirota bacterium]
MAGIKTPLAPPIPTEIGSTGTTTGLEARVIVLNCECHTYQQVVDLFCQHIPSMTSSKAFELAWKIDHNGEAIVFSGTLEQAEEIAAKLAGGGLRVAVQ